AGFRNDRATGRSQAPCDAHRSSMGRTHVQDGIRKERRVSIDPDLPLLKTQELLQEVREGRRDALEVLLARYRPRLARWAAGRLPGYARSLLDTGDLVQETLLRALENIGSIEARGPGAFEAYVRQVILNRIRDQIRWARRRVGEVASEEIVDP